MLHEFLHTNRHELIARCRVKAERRPAPRTSAGEMRYGVPLFLEQLIETLRMEHAASAIRKVSGSSAPARRIAPGELAASAAKHGHELLRQGYTVNQVVHDYGDLCQAVTDLAIEYQVKVSTDEFQTLNRCLDNAIADAVTEFALRRDELIAETSDRAASERLGFLAHELRNFLSTAMLSFAAIKSGSVAIDGATAAVLERSFIGLRDLIDRALTDVRLAVGVPVQLRETVAVDRFLSEVQVAASLEAKTRGCEFTVSPVAPDLWIQVEKQMLNSAISNLLQNAFKFTRPHSHVCLKAYGTAKRVLIEVEDQCGGLPEGKADSLFASFEQHSTDRSGLGLGLSISRRAVEASGGELGVRDMPGLGCAFTIDLPRYDADASSPMNHEERATCCTNS